MNDRIILTKKELKARAEDEARRTEIVSCYKCKHYGGNLKAFDVTEGHYKAIRGHIKCKNRAKAIERETELNGTDIVRSSTPGSYTVEHDETGQIEIVSPCFYYDDCQCFNAKDIFKEEQKPSLNPPFSSVYICHGMLEKQTVFQKIDKKELTSDDSLFDKGQCQ